MYSCTFSYNNLLMSVYCSGHLLGSSCSHGLRYVIFVLVSDCQFGFFPLGFWSGTLFLIATFPDHCLLLPL